MSAPEFSLGADLCPLVRDRYDPSVSFPLALSFLAAHPVSGSSRSLAAVEYDGDLSSVPRIATAIDEPEFVTVEEGDGYPKLGDCVIGVKAGAEGADKRWSFQTTDSRRASGMTLASIPSLVVQDRLQRLHCPLASPDLCETVPRSYERLCDLPTAVFAAAVDPGSVNRTIPNPGGLR